MSLNENISGDLSRKVDEPKKSEAQNETVKKTAKRTPLVDELAKKRLA